MILCSAVLMEHRLVTDGRTDRQTLGYSIYRASIASRDKKNRITTCVYAAAGGG